MEEVGLLPVGLARERLASIIEISQGDPEAAHSMADKLASEIITVMLAENEIYKKDPANSRGTASMSLRFEALLEVALEAMTTDEITRWYS